MDTKEKQDLQGKTAASVNKKLVNKDRPCHQEKQKNFKNLKKVTKWLKRTRNERICSGKGQNVGTEGTEFSPTGEVSQAAYPQDKCAFHKSQLGMVLSDALWGTGQHCDPWP